MSDKIEQKLSLMSDVLGDPFEDMLEGTPGEQTVAYGEAEILEDERGCKTTEMVEIPFEVTAEEMAMKPIPQPGVNPNRKMNSLSKKIIKEARAKGKILPHELLLYWANGVEIGGFRPTPSQQIYAAVAAAPYYAPKLANVEVKKDVRIRAVISAQPMTQNEWAAKYLGNPGENIDKPKEIEPAKVESERIDDDTL